MNKEIIIRDLIISLGIIFYFIITIRYFLTFRYNKIFTGKIKVFHLVMIWLIPFVWILMLKSLTTSTPGSHEVKDKNSLQPFSDNDHDASTASDMGF